MSESRKYRKKPVVIEARQWTSVDAAYDIADWADGDYHEALAGPVSAFSDGEDWGLFEIETLEGTHAVSPGDYVIRGVAGEFYPCKPDIFEATYEPAEASTTRVIPWPPSDDLVERVARVLERELWAVAEADEQPYESDEAMCTALARAVLDAIGGAGDE